MFTNSRLATSAAWLPLALLVAAGCKQGPSPEVQARIDSLSQASSEKERLMQEVAENTRLVSEISKELATVAVPKKRLKVGAAESPLRASRDTMVQKIRYITARVKELEPKLQQSEQRVRELSTLSDSLKDALASTIQNLQGVIDNQKETIAGLTDQVEKLSAENVALKDTIDNMATEANTVYYIVGTKDELEQRGIVKKRAAPDSCSSSGRAARRSFRPAISTPPPSRRSTGGRCPRSRFRPGTRNTTSCRVRTRPRWRRLPLRTVPSPAASRSPTPHGSGRTRST